MKRFLCIVITLLFCLPAASAGAADGKVIIDEPDLEDFYFGKDKGRWTLFCEDGTPFLDHTWTEEQFLGGFSHPFDGFHGENAAPIRFGGEQSSTYGCIDQNGKIILEPIYDYVFSFSEGLAAVRKDDLWAFVDEKGTFVTDFKFEDSCRFFHGAAPVKLDGKYGLIDREGNFLTEPAYDSLNFLGSGLFSAWQGDEVCCIDASGAVRIPPIYDDLGRLDNGLLRFSQSEKYGVLNLDGEILIPAQYDTIQCWEDGSFSGSRGGEVDCFAWDGSLPIPLSTVEHHFSECRYAPFSGDRVPTMEKAPALDSLPELRCTADMVPLCAGLMRGFYPETETALPICSHTDGLEAVQSGGCGLLLTAQASVSEGLRQTVLGSDALVFFVPQSNPIENLSLEDIRRIYTGDAAQWSALGQSDPSEILAYQRPEDSAAQEQMDVLTGGRLWSDPPMDFICKGWADASLEAIAYRNFPEAIGYALRSRLDDLPDDVKILSVDGVFPSEEFIADESYPLCLPVYAVTRPDDPTAQPLLDWLTSDGASPIFQNCRLIF